MKRCLTSPLNGKKTSLSKTETAPSHHKTSLTILAPSFGSRLLLANAASTADWQCPICCNLTSKFVVFTLKIHVLNVKSSLLEHSILPQALQSPPWQLQEPPGRSEGIDSARGYRPAVVARCARCFRFAGCVGCWLNSPCFLGCEGLCWDELLQISRKISTTHEKKHDV